MDTIQRFKEVKEQLDKLSALKIRIDERHKSEREKLEKLLKEITGKGYDPTKLSEIKATKEAELEKSLSELESKVKEISLKLNNLEVIND